jgi:GT2 family glycosyltransferase
MDFEVVVVDNGSTDLSPERLEREWPSVSVLCLGRNHGFAAAVNRGIAATETELVALINNDVELDDRWLEELVESIDSHPEAGSVTGKLLSYENRNVVNSAGVTGTWDGRFGGRGEGEVDAGQYDAPGPIFGATAGAGVYRREAFDRVGLFDESFFAYVEDIDWNFRAQYAGYECWYVPTARGYHIGSRTSKRVSGLMTYLLIRNTMWLVLKNFPARKLARFGHRIVFALAARSLSAVRGGAARAAINGWVDGLSGAPRALRARRALRELRVEDVRRLDRVMQRRHQ